MTRAQSPSRAGVAPAVEAGGGSFANLDQRPGLAGDDPPAPARATPSDSLFRRDGLYVMAAALQFVGGLVLTPFLTRQLGSADYGMVTTSMIIMQAVVTVAGLSLGTGLQRSYAHLGRDRARRVLGFVIVVTLALTLLLDVTGPLWVGAFGVGDYAGAARLAVWWGGATAIVTAQTCVLRSEDRLLGYAVLMALQSLLADLAGFALVLGVKGGATVFVAGKLGAVALGALVGLGLFPPGGFGRGDVPMLRNCLTFSVGLVPAVAAAMVITTFDRITLGHAHGSVEVARYQIACLLGMTPVLLLHMLANSWMPRFFAAGAPGAPDAPGVAGVAGQPGEAAEVGHAGATQHAFVRARDSLYRLVPWVLLGLAGMAPFVLRLWAPASFHTDELALISAVVALATIPEAATAVASRALLSAGKSAHLSWAVAIAAGTNVVWNLLAVPRFGLLGAATGAVAAYGVTMLAMTVLARRVGYRPSVSRRAPVLALAAAGSIALAMLPAGTIQDAACLLAAVISAVFGARVLWQLTR